MRGRRKRVESVIPGFDPSDCKNSVALTEKELVVERVAGY
jgi:hypothetical protein